jgi:putative addiction module component (TIGR02574 family)
MIGRAEIDRLTPQEKLLLVAEAWDSLSADESNVPVRDAEKRLLDQRWADYVKNPAGALTPEEFERLVDEGR